MTGGAGDALLGSHAADALGEILEASADPALNKRGRQWSAYAGLTRWHRYDGYDRLLKPLLTKEVIGSVQGVMKLAAIVDHGHMMRGARHEAMADVALSNLFRAGAPAPSPRQKKLLKRWQKLGDPALDEAARAWAKCLDLDSGQRSRLARELGKME